MSNQVLGGTGGGACGLCGGYPPNCCTRDITPSPTPSSDPVTDLSRWIDRVMRGETVWADFKFRALVKEVQREAEQDMRKARDQALSERDDMLARVRDRDFESNK